MLARFVSFILYPYPARANGETVLLLSWIPAPPSRNMKFPSVLQDPVKYRLMGYEVSCGKRS